MTRPDKPYYGEFSDDWARELQEDDRIRVVDIEDGEFGLDMGTKHVKFELKDITHLYDSDNWNLLAEELSDSVYSNLENIDEQYNDNLETKHIWSDKDIEFYIDELEHEYDLIQTKIDELDKILKLFALKVSLLSAEMKPKQD